MAKLTVFFLLIYLAFISLLAFFNKETVSLTIWKDIKYDEVPVIALIFISTAVGIVSMFIITAVRDTKRQIENWQIQRKHKKEARILESYSKGLEVYFASRYDEAEELFNGVLEHDPTHMYSLLRLGDVSVKRGDYDKAEDYYLRAKEVKPKSVETLLSLEKIAEQRNQWPEAVKYLDNILDIDSENIKILHMKRSIYERKGKYEEIVDVQNKIIKCKLSKDDEKSENEKLLGYKYELGRYQIEAGPVDKAIKNLKNVIKLDKNFTAAYIALSDAYVKDGNKKEALAVLVKGFEETSAIIFLVKLEDYYIKDGEPGTIIDIYQKAVQKNQKDLRLRFFLAKLYYRLEMIDYAMETINTIDASSLDYPDLHALIGSVYDRRSEFEMACEEFKKALNVDKPLLVPYCCSNCHFVSSDWSGRCPECSSWNTLVLDINEISKIHKRQSSS